MAERAEQMFWVHTRGLNISLPPGATRNIVQAAQTGNDIPQHEATMLRVLTDDPILKKRYSCPEDGEEYMQTVDTRWREELYRFAETVSSTIVGQTHQMGKEDIAVILIGSVAKNLVKTKGHPDPSNIDLVVVGDFNQEEREDLLNRVRCVREQVAGEIGNNVGVIVQDPDKLRKNDYSVALMYVGSSARALYDPKGVWSDLEKDTLEFARDLKKYNGSK